MPVFLLAMSANAAAVGSALAALSLVQSFSGL
jgi:hypothetical protein